MLKINEMYTCLQSEGKYTGIPHILIRMTGCPMRCCFGDSLCDSPYSSWVPETTELGIDQIYEYYAINSQINHTMITGGEPMFNPGTLQELIKIAKKFDHFITIETAGIAFVETDADFISISPKLSNSTPEVKTYRVGDTDVTVTSKLAERHERLRRTYFYLKELISYYSDYQIKPVISNIEKDMVEVETLIEELNIPKNKVYLMPAGSTNDELQKIRPQLMEFCHKEGYNYTDRIHIVAYGNQRGV